MAYKPRKQESLSGSITGRVMYKAGDIKQSFLSFALYVESKTKKEIRKLKAFGIIADSLAHYSEGDKLTVSVYRSDSGDDIIESFVEDRGESEVIVRNDNTMTKKSLQDRNKELAKVGMALVKIKLPEIEILALKRLSETLQIENEPVCKLEYIMDTLGVDYVNDRLRKEGLLGDSLDLSKTFAKRYQEVKGKLFIEALGINDIRE